MLVAEEIRTTLWRFFSQTRLCYTTRGDEVHVSQYQKWSMLERARFEVCKEDILMLFETRKIGQGYILPSKGNLLPEHSTLAQK